MSEDLIRRSDAIKAVAEVLSLNRFASFKDIKDFGRFAERMLRNAPSADRPQGSWRKHDDERDYCTRCKHIFKTRTITQRDKWTWYIDDLGYNFCPNCGAHMKGADDE